MKGEDGGIKDEIKLEQFFLGTKGATKGEKMIVKEQHQNK